MKLDNTMLMYGIYNVETLEKLINTVQNIHNVTSLHEKLFEGNITHLYSGCYTRMPQAYSNMQLIHYYSLELFKTNTYHCTGN